MKRVLFVDGEPNLRRLFLEELGDEGYEVRVAGTAQDVIQIMDAFQPEVVILEMWLPDMPGPEACRIIKGTNRHTRIIFHSHGPLPSQLAEWGGEAYVEKSFDLSGLKHMMDTLTGHEKVFLLTH